MEPTGYDTILFTFSEPRSVVRATLDSLRRAHTQLQVDLEFVQPDQHRITNATKEQCLEAVSNSPHTIMYIYLVAGLREHLEERGYTLATSGDGPFALHVRRRHRIAFHLGAIDELYGNDGPANPPHPYSGWLCSSVIYEITIVTPEDPSLHSPSKGLVELVINNCIG